MSCPYCDHSFSPETVTASNAAEDGTPLVCGNCAEICLLFPSHHIISKIKKPELEALKESPSWKAIEASVQAIQEQRTRKNKRTRSLINNSVLRYVGFAL